MELVDEIETQLRRLGHMQVHVEADAEARAARTAARRLSRPVETLLRRHVMLAALKDWPANELEQQIQDASLRNVISRIPCPLV